MPWSMPYSRRRSSFSSLDAVASTVAPARFASWMAARPTPPPPAWIKTVSPACKWPNSNKLSVPICRLRRLLNAPGAGGDHVPTGRGCGLNDLLALLDLAGGRPVGFTSEELAEWQRGLTQLRVR